MGDGACEVIPVPKQPLTGTEGVCSRGGTVLNQIKVFSRASVGVASEAGASRSPLPKGSFRQLFGWNQYHVMNSTTLLDTFVRAKNNDHTNMRQCINYTIVYSNVMAYALTVFAINKSKGRS